MCPAWAANLAKKGMALRERKGWIVTFVLLLIYLFQTDSSYHIFTQKISYKDIKS